MNLTIGNKKKVISGVNKQVGATLLEALAFLGITAVVILGAVSLLKSSLSSSDQNTLLNDVTSIRTGTKSLYSGQSGYGTGSLNATLIQASVIPGDLATATPNITNTWGGAVTVTGATSNFTISYASVPQDICTKAVAAGGGQGYISVAVNGATALVPPISQAQATTDCNATTNTIVWTAN